MYKISIYEAKTQLSKYIALIESGEANEIIIKTIKDIKINLCSSKIDIKMSK